MMFEDKTPDQLEHIAGCEQCFNYFTAGGGCRCRQYPSKHRIQESEFKKLLGSLRGPKVSDMMDQMRDLLREKFNDQEIDDDMDNVTIVPDEDWDHPEDPHPYRELDVCQGKEGDVRTVFGFYGDQKWEEVILVRKLTKRPDSEWNRWVIRKATNVETVVDHSTDADDITESKEIDVELDD